MAVETITFAESVCITAEAEETFIQQRIVEGEDFLAILRRQALSIANRVQEARRQLQETRSAFPLVKTDRMIAIDRARHRAVEAAMLGSRSDGGSEDEGSQDRTSSGSGESGVGYGSGGGELQHRLGFDREEVTPN